MLDDDRFVNVDYLDEGSRRTAWKEPCTMANMAPTAAKLAGLLSEGERMAIKAMAMTEMEVIAPIIEESVAISKVCFIVLLTRQKLLSGKQN